MSEAKHTPGPWSIVRYGDGSSLVIHSDEDNRVCFMATASQDRPSSHASIRANARLIVAAPAMFEALKDAERAIASLPEDALGYANDLAERERWPIKEELLHKIRSALSQAQPKPEDEVEG